MDSATVIFDQVLPLNVMSEHQINTLLQRLAATHLTASEIVAASLKRRSRGRSDQLDLVQMSRDRYGVMTTGNPYYMAFTEPTLDGPD
jgi:hypothetical protein